MRSFLLVILVILPLILSGQFKSFYPEKGSVIAPGSSMGFHTSDGKSAPPKIRWKIQSNRLETVREDGQVLVYHDVRGHIFYKDSGLPAAFLTVSFLYRHDAARQYITVKDVVSDSTGYFHLREKTDQQRYNISVIRYE